MKKSRRNMILSVLSLVALDIFLLWDAPSFGVAAAAVLFQLAGVMVGYTIGTHTALADIWMFINRASKEETDA